MKKSKVDKTDQISRVERGGVGVDSHKNWIKVSMKICAFVVTSCARDSVCFSSVLEFKSSRQGWAWTRPLSRAGLKAQAQNPDVRDSHSSSESKGELLRFNSLRLFRLVLYKTYLTVRKPCEGYCCVGVSLIWSNGVFRLVGLWARFPLPQD